MTGKSIKLIIGIILLIIALALYFFSGLASWIALIPAVIGIVLIVLAFTGKAKLPAVSLQPEAPAKTEPAAEPAPKVEPEEAVAVPEPEQPSAEVSSPEQTPEKPPVAESIEEESRPQV